MKKIFIMWSSLLLLSNVVVYAQDEENQSTDIPTESQNMIDSNNIVQVNSRVAVGASNSSEQVNQLLKLFGLDESTSDDVIKIDGVILNEHINDGSNESTDVYSSVLVNLNESGSGVAVEILTPENITSVSDSAYQNAAITAGAKNAEIKIASVVKVTGEGALGGVYEIFSQAGYDLNAKDIQTAENLIQIEEILLAETNMTEREISQLITKYNLAIVVAVEDKEELTEQEVTEILYSILDEFNFQYSENVRKLLVEHGIAFSQSDVSKDPETKLALEETMKQYESMNQIYSHGNIQAEITDFYLTEERNEYLDFNFDNVFTVHYTLTNLGDTETSAGRNFSLYVNGQKAEDYYLLDDIQNMVSPNRNVNVKQSFGFNGEANLSNMELELRDMRAYGQPAVIIPLDGSNQTANQEEAEVTSEDELTEEFVSSVVNPNLVEILKAFQDAELNVMEPKVMTREDFGIAPLLADEAVRFGAQYAEFPIEDEDGNLDIYNYGRLFLVNNEDDLMTMKSVYDELAKQSAMLYSHTYAKGNVLLQMGGDVPDEDFAKYTAVIDKIVE